MARANLSWQANKCLSNHTHNWNTVNDRTFTFQWVFLYLQKILHTIISVACKCSVEYTSLSNSSHFQSGLWKVDYFLHYTIMLKLDVTLPATAYKSLTGEELQGCVHFETQSNLSPCSSNSKITQLTHTIHFWNVHNHSQTLIDKKGETSSSLWLLGLLWH